MITSRSRSSKRHITLFSLIFLFQLSFFFFFSLLTDRYPGLNYDFETNSGRAYPYFSFGAACSEVEIDCLTGDHQVLEEDRVSR